MKTHRFVRQVAENELSEFESYPILEALSKLDLGPSHADVGKLACAVDGAPTAGGEDVTPLEFVPRSQQTRHRAPCETPGETPGRGSVRLRSNRSAAGPPADRENRRRRSAGAACGSPPAGRDDDIHKRAALLRRDSVHGAFNGTIRVDEDNQCLIVNGNVVRMIYAQDRAKIDYTRDGIDNAILIDNSGVWAGRGRIGRAP